MAFSKSKTKRFNELTTCAPPVGAYDVMESNNTKIGPISFEKTDRFARPKDPTPGPGGLDDSPCSVKSTPTKKQSRSAPSTPDMNRHRQLEREINRMLQLRLEHDQKMSRLEADLQRAEARVQATIKEKTSLQASMASLDMANKELQKTNNVLKNKIENVEKLSRKHDIKTKEKEMHAAKLQLQSKEQELAELQSSMDLKVEGLQADIEQMEANMAALREQNLALERTNAEITEHGEKTESQVMQLHGLTDQLRSENLRMEELLGESRKQQLALQAEFQQSVHSARTKLSQVQEEWCLKLKHATLLQAESERKLDMANGQIESLQSEIAALHTTQASLEQQIAHLGENVATATGENQQWQEENQRLQQEVQGHVTRLGEDRQRLAGAEDRVRQLQHQMQTMEGDHERMRQEQMDVAKVKDSRIQSLEGDLERRMEELGQQQEAIHQANLQIKELQESLEKNEEMMTENMRTLSEKYQMVERSLVTVETESHAHSQHLQAELERRQNRCSALEQDCDNLQRKNIELVEQLNMEKESKETMKLELGKSRKELETHLQVMAQLEKTRLDLEAASQSGQSFLGRLDALETVNSDQKNQIADLQAELSTVQREANEERERLQGEVGEAEGRLAELRAEVEGRAEEAEERNQLAKQEYSRRLVETQKRLSLTAAQFQKYKTEAAKEQAEAAQALLAEKQVLEESVAGLRSQLQSCQAEEGLKEQVAKWQGLYTELQAKVEPFQVQLDAFEAEKNFLLSQNCRAQDEVSKLGQEYAKLLGHQNQKQKIQHVVRLKEENLTLKKEVAQLRDQTGRQNREVKKLQERVGQLEVKGGQRPKRFDPSKAFQHCKENVAPLSPNNSRPARAGARETEI